MCFSTWRLTTSTAGSNCLFPLFRFTAFYRFFIRLWSVSFNQINIKILKSCRYLNMSSSTTSRLFLPNIFISSISPPCTTFYYIYLRNHRSKHHSIQITFFLNSVCNQTVLGIGHFSYALLLHYFHSFPCSYSFWKQILSQLSNLKDIVDCWIHPFTKQQSLNSYCSFSFDI